MINKEIPYQIHQGDEDDPQKREQALVTASQRELSL